MKSLTIVCADYDVDTTFEGDNTVLTQQVTKALLAQVAERVKSGVEPFPHVEVPDVRLY